VFISWFALLIAVSNNVSISSIFPLKRLIDVEEDEKEDVFSEMASSKRK